MKFRLLICTIALLVSANVYAFDIVNPDAEQLLIKDADLRNVGMDIGVYAGLMNYENFNSSYMLALYFIYPFDEDLFIELEAGAGSVSDTEYRNIGLPLFSQEQADVEFFTVLVGYNFLPGEMYWSQSKALRSDLYILGGVGSVSIDNNDSVALHLGVGFKIEVDVNKGVRFEFRDRMIDSDILGTDLLSNNTEFHLGMDWKF